MTSRLYYTIAGLSFIAYLVGMYFTPYYQVQVFLAVAFVAYMWGYAQARHEEWLKETKDD